jgi:nicotinamide phosphoribosyltransferase
LPVSILTDSYKATHFFQYPDAREVRGIFSLFPLEKKRKKNKKGFEIFCFCFLKMVAYGEFRKPFQKDETDQRIVCYGMRYIIETYVAQKWTENDVELADRFFKTHNAGFTKLPFPKDSFMEV